jgi:hypothetical protein
MADGSYKVLGKFADGSGAGVRGVNTATSGTPIGVEGVVDHAEGYGLYTGDDAFVGGTLTSATVSVTDAVSIDFTGTDGGDHGLEVVDRSSTNSEQISIKADPDGSAELVFQDTDESNYKWGFRANQKGDFLLDDHASLTSRLEFGSGGPTCVLNTALEVVDGPLAAQGNDGHQRAVDASGGSVRSAGGVINRQRGDPSTTELQPGENMTYNADGSGTGDPGDLVYAVNDGGTIKTSVLARRSDATA